MPEPKATEAQASAAGLATPQNLDLIAQGDDAILLNARFTKDALDAADAAGTTAGTAAAKAAALESRTEGLAAGSPNAWNVRDKQGRVAVGVKPDGTVQLAGTDVTPAAKELRIMDTAGRIAFWLKPDGTIEAPGLAGGAGGSGAAARVVLVLAMGQSNMEGRGRPYGPGLDPADPRLLMWHWPAAELRTATVPLSSQQQQTGLSPASVIGRRILAEEPPGTHVVIVNAAVGNTSLYGENVNGVWAVDYAGTAPKLFSIAMNAYAAARAAVVARFGMAPETRVYWHQGEGNQGSEENYASALDALIDATRAQTGTDTPFTVGGIVPEYLAVNTNRAPTVRAHVQTPARRTLTAYAPGVPNGGGSASVDDIVHYSRQGVEVLGAAMYQAGRRALANTSASVPVPPLTVTARLVSGTLTATWAAPFCRVTAYTAEYSTDGGTTWSAFPARAAALELSATASGITSPALVRVATINETATSAPTSPVTAIGA